MNSTDDVVQLGRVLWSLNAYDYFLTLDDEVVFLTQSQWKWAKLPYLVCRGIATHDVDSRIFLARTCAIWEFRRRMIAMFMISGLLYVIAGHVMLSINRSAPQIMESPISVTSCFETGEEGNTIIIVYVILAAAEIQIWMFTLYKAVAAYWREGTHNRLLEQLVGQNMIYMTCGLIILTTVRVKVSGAKAG
ncbi:hypothetical protein EDD22DRAFT_842949 [Suillus occidentalis]|nr:hypothetical protein EDD22DRAFT_842949 [Suillus occidentalis]